MNAHQLDANGVITNTIVADSLDVFPGLIDAELGGTIGDTYDPVAGTFTPPAGPAYDLPAAIAAAIAKTYLDVDAVYDDAIGRRGTEYAEAEADARTFIAPGYTGVASAYVSDFALNNPTGVQQTDTWAANQIIARADAFRNAQLSMRSTRFARQKDMRAATTEAGLATAVGAWDGYIATLRVQLGL